MSAGGVIKLGGVVVVSAAALAGLARLAGVDLGLGGDASAGIEGAEAKRGPLRISVIERANLKAANSVELKCELEGRSTILWLIDEGALVQPGDLVCELDTKEQVERQVQQGISVQHAEAAHIKATQNLKIQESQNLSDIKKAEQDLDFARQDREKYLEGEYPQLEKEADEAITLAEEDRTRKENELNWSKILHDKGHLTDTQLAADQFAFNSADILYDQRLRAKELLTKYDHPRRKDELNAAIDEAERELDRVKLQAEARIADYKADERTSLARLELERAELVKLEDQIEKAKMFAPVAGMVVYAAEESRRWGSGEPIQEGTEVRERQSIITIPSSEGMIAEMSLHESVLEKVSEGMPCLLTVDALPNRTFPGRVKFKSTLPDQNSWWANPDLRVYRTQIEVLENDPDLKSGMSSSVEIIVEDIEDAIHVPVQSIFLNAGKTSCFIASGGDVDLRAVEVGLDNGKWVQVHDGIAEGEVVLLAQPTGFTLEPAIEETRPIDEFEFPAMSPTGGERRGERGGERSWGGEQTSGRKPGGASADATGRPAGASGGKSRPSGGSPGGGSPGGKGTPAGAASQG